MFQNEAKLYPHLKPDLQDWAIYRQSEDRDNFVDEVVDDTEARLLEEFGQQLPDLLSKTIYSEVQRTKEEPWKVDPPKERSYWKKMSKRLARRSLDVTEKETAEQAAQRILQKIVRNYAEEIVGTFKIGHFKFARRFLSFFFGRLLNAAVGRSFRSIFSSKAELKSKLLVKGYVDEVRGLYDKGSIVIVPTHFSNIDSIMIGYILDAVAGLPASAYGAGLNLYNTGYTAYFMNRLGAYRVDRRKRNPIYNRTLKQMAKLSIKRGVPNIFFPGGTRSRSGSLESKLKLGLLSSAMEAQREFYQEGKQEKVFIVPLVMSYPFVLEAQFLVEQHLKKQGQDRYIKYTDSFHSLRSILKFIWGVFSKSNRITISLGQPMDVLGNRVDGNGQSYGGNNVAVDTREYFQDADGVVNTDYQRESEYLRMLGDKIVDRFHRDNVVISSHLVSHAAFLLLKNSFPKLDFYALLRLPPEDYIFEQTALLDVITQLQSIMQEMELKDEIKLADSLRESPQMILENGVRSLGNFHIEKPLRINPLGNIVSENFSMLYFYHNRLASYGFEKQLTFAAPEKALSLADID
ncbi:glycerol acyltransferase [Lewinellaceae bacterium SD302]|nr:glycerol acyltransferase [Lewinellaceae bacterium SD302]